MPEESTRPFGADPNRLTRRDQATTPDCAHLTVRPRWESDGYDGYVCAECCMPFTAEQAEQLCDEVLLRARPVSS